MKTKTFKTGSKSIKIFRLMGWKFLWSDSKLNLTQLVKFSK